MEDMKNEEILKCILGCILERVTEIDRMPRNEINDAKRLAYYELLNTIQGQLEINDISVGEYGLDFTLEDML